MAPPIDLRTIGDRIEDLVARLESSLDARAFAQVQEVIGLVTELYGGGLARIIELASEDPPRAGEDSALLERMADDDLVASLLVLHDLHPLDLDARVGRALDSVRPYLASHGGDVEVLGLDAEAGVVALRLVGSCDGCASSSVTLELAVQAAIEQAAPEIVRIDVVGVEDPAQHDGHAAGPTPVTLGRKPDAVDAVMAPVYGLRALVEGRVGPLVIDGNELVVCRVASQLYAYRSACPQCDSKLDDARLDGPVLRCAACGAAYDIPRAGRSLDGHATHLDPLPLIETGGEVRIAVRAMS